MKKVFLDIGAHHGETAKIALEKKYKFDELYCFEPVHSCCCEIKKINDKRIKICEFGFWNKNCTKKIYGAGGKGASLYRDKFRQEVKAEKIKLINVSEWFSDNVSQNDKIYLKINCEGSECVILDELISSGEYKKIDVLMVDFDVRKIPSQKHLRPIMKEKIDKLGIPKVFYVDEYNLGRGTHSYFTHYWLDNS